MPARHQRKQLSQGYNYMLYTVKPVLSGHSKRIPNIAFQDRLSHNAGQMYCSMLLEHSAILLTFIKLPMAIKTFVLSIFEWPLKTSFTILCSV